MLFHIPTTSLFELDALDGEVLSLLAEKGQLEEADVQARFAGQDPAELDATAARVHGSRHRDGWPSAGGGTAEYQDRELSAVDDHPEREHGLQPFLFLLLQGGSRHPQRGSQDGVRHGCAVDRPAASGKSRPRGLQHRLLRRRAAVEHAADPGGGGPCRAALCRPWQAGQLHAHHQRDAAERRPGGLARRTPLRPHSVDGRTQGAARPQPQDRRRQGLLRCGGRQGAHAAVALPVAAGGRAGDVDRRRDAGRGDLESS